MSQNQNNSCPIPLLFVTTSSTKFAHLRYLGRKNGVEVRHAPLEYEELQNDNLEILLQDAMSRNALSAIQDTFFTIEQTSVFFEAYDGKPGQFFKRWWQMKSEDDLKTKLSRNPTARIESGLALNIPGPHDPLIFTNEQVGQVSFEGKILDENEQYPWLSSEDFNLYFVPKGANKVYNQMPLREFRKYDFRKPNVDKICERLHEYGSILSSKTSLEELQSRVEELATESIEERPRQVGLDDYLDK